MSRADGIPLCLVLILFAVAAFCVPVPDSEPLIANGWGQSVRLRHLYAARHGVNLQINEDGTVDSSSLQSLYRVKSAYYLCMEESGKLYGSRNYVKEHCSFRERILSDGYSIYVSDRYRAVVTLSIGRQKVQAGDKGLSSLSQFLPMASTLSLGAVDVSPKDPGPRDSENGKSPLQIDSMGPFGDLSQVFIHSPSFNKR
ncbi:fibroblast growth factor 19-like isoform X2 [Paramormyrops kingsleyae]|uniref:fibroblast growth factor 19-like isoform X2 n=1 Tax=Paramormyrops kingsleyae TaxID=1676925 RepID=UPI003B9724E2